MNVLTWFYKCLLNPSSKSVVLKPFHVKDPQSYMYLAADPHLKICRARDPPGAEIWVKKFALKNIYAKIFQKFHDFSKIADLQACSAAVSL